MKKQPRAQHLSWPTVLIAVVALTLGSLGTAAAGPAVGKITVAKVKKIAATVVKKKAKTLTVARAKNADKLGGKAPSTYLDRANYASSNVQVALPAGFTNSILGPISITVPDGVGLLRIDGAATFTGAAGGFGVYYALDGPCDAAVANAEAMYANTSDGQDTAGFSVLKEVTPGDHAVRLCSNNSAMNVNQRQILVETVAGGPTGGPTISRPTDSRHQPSRPGVAAR